jgi:hypothetical protein
LSRGEYVFVGEPTKATDPATSSKTAETENDVRMHFLRSRALKAM